MAVAKKKTTAKKATAKAVTIDPVVEEASAAALAAFSQVLMKNGGDRFNVRKRSGRTAGFGGSGVVNGKRVSVSISQRG